jgi:hypothetical protein
MRCHNLGLSVGTRSNLPVIADGLYGRKFQFLIISCKTINLSAKIAKFFYELMFFLLFSFYLTT